MKLIDELIYNNKNSVLKVASVFCIAHFQFYLSSQSQFAFHKVYYYK